MRKSIFCVLLLSLSLTACTLPGLGGSAKSGGIVVAGGSISERQILSEIVVQMVNHYIPEADTGIINNLGTTYLILQTIEREDANISGAMYTGTSLTGELGLPATTDPDQALEQVVKGYYEQLDMIWFPSYGFENTYAFMVTEDFAAKHQLSKVSDLSKLQAELRVGVNTSWLDREGDGYEAFKEIYGFEFGYIVPMEIGLVYDALKNEEMDVVLGYSTDGRIQANQLVLLEDDRRLFPPYDAAPAVTLKVLERYPDLEEVILKLEGTIDNQTMQELNRSSDEDKVEPQIVAKRFLEKNNYFEDKKVVPLSERPLYQALKKGEESNDQ
jgi:glycine betaine/choline ABC-type transport system substrate-binding protein